MQADHQKLSRFVDAASLLKQGKRITDVPELAWFNSWHDVHEYCETNDGSDIKPLVKLVDDHLVVEPEQEAEDLMVAGNEILIGNRRLVFHLAKLT